MSSIALERTDVIVGVDTHKDEHVAVVIDGRTCRPSGPGRAGYGNSQGLRRCR